jgi:thymidylate synthase ThyX
MKYRRSVAVSEFSAKERAILGPYFTNLDRGVFALRNLPEVVKGALFSRYSRSSKSVRRIFLDEFVNNPDLDLAPAASGAEDDVVAAERAEQFYERVLVGYGDDSVAELGGAHVALEGISALAAKEIEDSRIGLSPLEKSTRYVFFDRQVDGRFEYVRPHDLMHSPLAEIYTRSMDACFQLYSDAINPLSDMLTEQFPRDDGVSERAHRAAIRAKAADILRSLLPAGHLTNVGLFGNGRAYEYLLIKMAASQLAEVRELGYQLGRELALVIPAFTRRAGSERGRDHSAYLRNREQTVSVLVPPPSGREPHAAPVTILDYEPEAETKVLASLLYPHADQPLIELRRYVDNLDLAGRLELLHAHLDGRQGRHRKPGRAFEMADYTVEFCANFGVYKDLQRHRLNTQQRQRLSTNLGYSMPPEIAGTPFEERFRECMAIADAAYQSLVERFPYEAQYAVPAAYRMRWMMKLNLRELCHMVELRSTIQGHPDYRAIVHELTRQVRAIHPVLGELATQFVDWSDVDLARLQSEQRNEEKAQALGLG